MTRGDIFVFQMQTLIFNRKGSFHLIRTYVIGFLPVSFPMCYVSTHYSQIASILLVLFYIPLGLESRHSDWISNNTDSWNIRPRRHLGFLIVEKCASV